MDFLLEALNAEERNNLKDKEFGLPEERKFPLNDAAHVRSAIAFFKYCPKEKRKELAKRIMRAAKKFGIKISPNTRIYSLAMREAFEDEEYNDESMVVLEADDDDEDDTDELDVRDAAMDDSDEPTDYTSMLDDEPELDGNDYTDDSNDDIAGEEDLEPNDYTEMDPDTGEDMTNDPPEEEIQTTADDNPDAPDEEGGEDYTDEVDDNDDNTEDIEPEDYTQDVENDESTPNDINSNVRPDDTAPADNNNDNAQETNPPEEGNAPDDEPNDYTQDTGVGDDNGEMGDDTEGNPEGEPNAGGDVGVDPSAAGSELQNMQNDVFSNLSPNQIMIKTATVKQSFIDLYNDVVEILERLSVVNKSSENLEALNFAADTLTDLKGMLNDAIVTSFDTKSLVENQITLQRFMAVYAMVVNILEKIGNKKSKLDKK